MDRSGDAHDQCDGSTSCEYLLQDSLLLFVTVGKLRGKMKQVLGYDPILTVHGIGYRLHTPANNDRDFHSVNENKNL